MGFANQVRAQLLSEEGIYYLSRRRNVELESVFRPIKHHWGFRRSLPRGKEKNRVGLTVI